MASAGRMARVAPAAALRVPLCIAVALATWLHASSPGATITLTSSASDLTGAIVDGSSSATSVVGATFVAIPLLNTPHGIGSALLGGFPTDGATFAILTTGNAAFANQPNIAGNTSANNGGGNIRGNTDFDVSILRIDLDVPSGANCLSFDFRFLSDEFPEYVGTAYNDAFIAELDSSTWITNGSTITAPRNFAFDPIGNVISINAAGVTSMTEGHAGGTTYDGATPLLTASTAITSGAHSLFLSIFDQGDHVYDSAVFLDRLILGTTGTGGCLPGATLLAVSKTTTTPVVGSGGTVHYTIQVDNPGGVAVALNSIIDVLPAGFSYIGGSTSGVTTTEPTVEGESLFWTGPFTLGANSTVSLSFSATASTIPGEYLNNASATVPGVAVTQSGPTAQVIVIANTSTQTSSPTSTPTVTPTPPSTSTVTPTPPSTLTPTVTSPPPSSTPTPAGPCGPADLEPMECSQQQPCDVLVGDETCPGEAQTTEDSTSVEVDADTLCLGATVRVIRSKSGEFTDSADSGTTVCGSECFASCTHHCAVVPIQQCYHVCVQRCSNGLCVQWETRCERSRIEHECGVSCFDQCDANADPLTHRSFFQRRCGFPISETVQVRSSDGACTGTTISTHNLSGAGAVAVNLPLPLTPGSYDVCHGTTLLRTVAVQDCGVPACSLTVADVRFVLTRGHDASISVDLAATPEGGSFSLSLHRFDDDAHTVPLGIPPFLAAPSLAVADTAVTVSAVDPQPVSGQTHWANVLLIAEGPATCSVGIHVDVLEEPPSDTPTPAVPAPTHTPTVPSTLPPAPTTTHTPDVVVAGTATSTPTVASITSPTSTPPLSPNLTVEPPGPHHFGALRLGSRRVFTYEAGNTGTAPLTGTVTAPCAGFLVEPAHLSLDVGQRADVRVTFAPPSLGPFTCPLTFTTSGGNLELTQSGEGEAVPAIPFVGSPLSPGGLVMIGLLAVSIGWALRPRRVAR